MKKIYKLLIYIKKPPLLEGENEEVGQRSCPDSVYSAFTLTTSSSRSMRARMVLR